MMCDITKLFKSENNGDILVLEGISTIEDIWQGLSLSSVLFNVLNQWYDLMLFKSWINTNVLNKQLNLKYNLRTRKVLKNFANKL